MRLVLSLLSLMIFCLSAPPAQAQTEFIAAVVKQDVISTTDLGDRLRMILVSSGLPNNDDTRAKLTPQIMNVLIEEQIKIQETRRLNIEISQE